MDVTKVQLQTDPRYTFSGQPVYLLLSGSKKLLVTAGLLRARSHPLHDVLHPPPMQHVHGRRSIPGRSTRLKVGQGVKVKGTKIYRIDPRKLSKEQRRELVGKFEPRDLRKEFIKRGTCDATYQQGDQVQGAIEPGRRSGTGTLLQSVSPDGVINVQWWTGAIGTLPVNWAATEIERTAITQREDRPKFSGVGVKETAKAAGVSPVELRRFLRAKKIGKRGGRYYFTHKESAKIAKAAKKYYAD